MLPFHTAPERPVGRGGVAQGDRKQNESLQNGKYRQTLRAVPVRENWYGWARMVAARALFVMVAAAQNRASRCLTSARAVGHQ